MIGHFLLTLTPEQEDRVLTRHMRARGVFLGAGACLLITAFFKSDQARADFRPYAPCAFEVADQFDGLCDRFGEARVNTAIRNRILANRARRVLAPVSVETVGQPQS